MKKFSGALWIAMTLVAAAQAVPPVAIVGVDNTAFQECTGFGVAPFALDGTESYDPDGGSLTYSWTGPFGTASGATPTVFIPLGAHEVTLTVTDEDLETAFATFTAVTIDTHDPVVDVTLFPSTLFPTGVMTTISAFVDVQDVCGAGFSFVLDSVTTSEPEIDSILNAALDTPDTSFDVLAATSSVGGLRSYSVVYKATDSSGNTGTGTAQVLVTPPSDRQFFVNPDRMIFDYTLGGPPAASLTATVASQFYSSFHVNSTASWLHASPQSGDTPEDLVVWVDPEGLEPGNHTATLLVSSGGGHVEPIQVLLRVYGEPDLFTLPETLSLELDTYTGVSNVADQLAPLTKQIFVGARQSPAALTLSTDVPWLQAAVVGPTTPTYITVAADPAGLSTGLYTGNVVMTSDNPRSEPLSLPVSLEVKSSAKFLAPEFVVHAATMKRLPVAPGSLISAFYFNPDGVTANADAMPLPTELGGLSATVEGKPLRFIHVSPMQFNAQLPGDLDTGVARMQLFFEGEPMGETALQVVPAAPGVFSHQGDALALNQDGSLNGPENPAEPGTIVSMYLTGQGVTNPSVPDGAAAPGAPFAKPILPVHVTIDGRPVEPQFVGLAPGQAGLLQLNLPTSGMPPGPRDVAVGIGGAASNKAAIYVGQ